MTNSLIKDEKRTAWKSQTVRKVIKENRERRQRRRQGKSIKFNKKSVI